MITAKRGKETTEIELEGKFIDIMLESISVVECIRARIVEGDHPEEVIFHYVNALIDAAWGK